MTNQEQSSVWNEIKKKVEGDLAKSSFDNLKNYGVIGLLLMGFKKALLSKSWFLIGVSGLTLIPAWFLFLNNLLHTQVITTLALIGKKGYAARAFGNKATTKQFFDAARWQFISAILITLLSPIAAGILILVSIK